MLGWHYTAMQHSQPLTSRFQTGALAWSQSLTPSLGILPLSALTSFLFHDCEKHGSPWRLFPFTQGIYPVLQTCGLTDFYPRKQKGQLFSLGR